MNAARNRANVSQVFDHFRMIVPKIRTVNGTMPEKRIPPQMKIRTRKKRKKNSIVYSCPANEGARELMPIKCYGQSRLTTILVVVGVSLIAGAIFNGSDSAYKNDFGGITKH